MTDSNQPIPPEDFPFDDSSQDDKSQSEPNSIIFPEDGEQNRPNLPEILKPARSIVERVIQVLEDSAPIVISQPASGGVVPDNTPPWTLQQYFNGEIDLAVELSNRFSSTPLMSVIRFRTLGTHTERGVATISTPDGSADVIFDVDAKTKIVQVSFTFGSMLTLRFSLRELVDRHRWLELMRREEGGMAFLWGPSRWEKDYVICIARRYYSNFYAFSPNGYEAAVRLTPDVTTKLLDWLEGYWKDEDKPSEEPPPMLTW